MTPLGAMKMLKTMADVVDDMEARVHLMNASQNIRNNIIRRIPDPTLREIDLANENIVRGVKEFNNRLKKLPLLKKYTLVQLKLKMEWAIENRDAFT